MKELPSGRDHMESKKKKAGEIMAGGGMLFSLLVASGFDAPGNDIRMVCTLMAIGMTVAIIGALMADLWT